MTIINCIVGLGLLIVAIMATGPYLGPVIDKRPARKSAYPHWIYDFRRWRIRIRRRREQRRLLRNLQLSQG